MSGEIATSLLGAQEGGEASFASLYELTNPALVRYLRVVSDADPSNLALTTWTTLLRRLPSSEADENAWLELVVGVARLAVEDARQRESWSHLVDPTEHLPPLALADLEMDGAADGPTDSAVEVGAPSPAQGIGAAPGATAPDEVTDRVDSAIAALRTCPSDEADLLAMRATAWLNRDAICRLTGRDAASVRGVLDQALEHVGLPLFTLVKALRAPARPDELVDLPVVLHLFTNGRPEQRVAAVGTAAAAVAAAGAVGEPSVLNLLDVPAAHASSAASQSAGTAAGAASHLGWVGATAAAAAIAVGGVGAAWNGLLPDLFGGHGHQRAPSAAGPAQTGPPTGGDTGHQEPPTTGRQPVTSPPTPRVREPGAGQGTTGAAQGTVSLGRVQLAVQVVKVPGSARGPGTVVAGTPPSTPTQGPAAPPPTQKPSTPVSQPPTTPTTAGQGTANGHTRTRTHGKAEGQTKDKAQGKAKGHAKTNPGKAKGHTKDKAKGHAYGHGKTAAPSGGGKRSAKG